MKKILLVMLLLFTGGGLAAMAQETTAAIQGTVTDPSGAVVVNALISVSAPHLARLPRSRPTAMGSIA